MLSMSLPTLSTDELSHESWRRFKRDARRVSALHPAATLAVLLPSNLQDLLEDTLCADLTTSTEEEIDQYVLELLAPVNDLSLLDELKLVKCPLAEPRTSTKRVTAVRQYISAYTSVYRRRAAIEAAPAADVDEPTREKTEQDAMNMIDTPEADETPDETPKSPTALEVTARLQFLDGLKPNEFKTVVKTTLKLRDSYRKMSLAEATTETLKIARQDDEAFEKAVRFGYYKRTTTPARVVEANTDEDEGNSTTSTTSGSLGRRKRRNGQPSAIASDRVNNKDPKQRAPPNNCKFCGGIHWHSQCSERTSTDDTEKQTTNPTVAPTANAQAAGDQPRYSRATGTLRPNPPRHAQEANLLNEDADAANGPLTTTGQVNGRQYSFIIDTGAGDCIMSAKTVETLGLTTRTGPTRHYILDLQTAPVLKHNFILMLISYSHWQENQ